MNEFIGINQFEQLIHELQTPLNADKCNQLKALFEKLIHENISLGNTLVDKLPLPAFIIDNQGTILHINEKWEEILGFKKEDAFGTPITNYIPPSQKEIFAGLLPRIINNEDIQDFEIKILKKDGSSLSAGLNSFSLNPEQHILLLRDIGIIKKLEKELSKSRVKLQKSEQFKSVFLANMSHEIRTPMNAIIGFSELINIEGISPEKRNDYSKIINQRGQQLLALIDDIIEITKIEAGRVTLDYTWIELDEFMHEIFSTILHRKLKEGKDNIELVLKKQESESIEKFYTDPGRLQQILINLISYTLRNSIKGNIIFGYKKADEKQVEFFIQDSSSVLNSEEQKMIFDHFWKIEDTTHQKIKGAGLGLTISKSLVELFGGKINVASDAQQGTIFYFTLPVIQPQTTELAVHDTHFTEEEQALILEPNWKNKVILIVEDDLVNYQFLEALLEKSQAQVLHAENGDQALELCKSISKIDLILMDIKLPEKNGYEITREIKSFRKEIPIIAQTAFSLNEVKDRCLSSGCDDIITKPVDIEAFFSKLNKYLA